MCDQPNNNNTCISFDEFQKQFNTLESGYIWFESESKPLFLGVDLDLSKLTQDSHIAEGALLSQTHSYTLRSINGKLKIYHYALDYQQQDEYKIIEHLWQSKKSGHKILMHEVWRLDSDKISEQEELDSDKICEQEQFCTYKPYAWVFAGFR